MTDFLDLARTRFSCRSYLPRAVEDSTILSILEAGRIAPSACNLQPWHFVVVRSDAQLAGLRESYPREWFQSVSSAIVVCGDHGVSWKRNDGKDHCDIDVAIAVDHMTLQAAAQGLGTCWICAFDAEKCAAVLNLPANVEPIVIIALGYPAEKGDPMRHASARKSLSALLHWERFSCRIQ